MTKFLLIRHATTDAVGKSLSGRQPGIHLNYQGNAEAAALADELTTVNINAIYSSPLDRALETAAPIAKTHQLQYIVDPDFLELDFGDWTDQPFAALTTDLTFSRFNTFRSGTRIPAGEMMLEAQCRIVRGMQKLAARHPEEVVAIISHSDMIKAAVAFYAGIPIDMMQRIEISPASLSIVDLYDDFASLQLLNKTIPLNLT